MTNILRKLEVTDRTRAAAVAERAGLLDQSKKDGLHRFADEVMSKLA